MIGERPVYLGERLGFVPVKQAPVLPDQQLAQVVAPGPGGDAGRLERKPGVGKQRVTSNLADQAERVVAALHRPVAERKQRAAGRELRGRAPGRVAVKALARDLDPAREAKRLALRPVPSPSPFASRS